MARKGKTTKEIIAALREVEALLAVQMVAI